MQKLPFASVYKIKTYKKAKMSVYFLVHNLKKYKNQNMAFLQFCRFSLIMMPAILIYLEKEAKTFIVRK